jgi:uncharacterized protein YkvS
MGKKEIYTAKISETHTEKSVSRTIEVPIMEGYQDLKLPTKHLFKNGGFITVFQKTLNNIILFANLSKNEMTLLLYLIANCNQDNSVCVDLNILSDTLKIKKPNISSALKGLVLRNIILRRDGYRYGKNALPMELSLNYDQINYNVAYNGKIKNFAQKKEKHPLLTEADGRTLLEDHRQGQPYRVLQDNGKYLKVDSDGVIVGDTRQLEMFPDEEQHSIE